VPGQEGHAGGRGHQLLQRWEGLPSQAQIVIAFPTLVVVLFFVHLILFLQPVARSIFYAFFWAILGTYLVVIATRTEAAKRANRQREDETDEH
jgi:hypothetical protein